MLVGRAREQAVIDASLNGVSDSRGAGLVLRGEAGIGKSTLLAYLQREATDRGWAVSTVVGIDGGWTPPYAAWSSMLDQLGADTTFLVAQESEDANEHRYRVLQSLIAEIRGVAVRRPVAIVLDDLQWLDSSSLAILVPLWRGVSTSRVLLAIAWRTPLAEREPALADIVTALFREPAIGWLELTGLSDRDVQHLADGLGATLDSAQQTALVQHTNGNPYFLTEILRQGNIGGEQVPPSIGHVVRSRLLGLPETTLLVLHHSAIFSRGVSFSVLQQVLGLADTILLAALAPALEQDLLREIPERPEHYTFVHGIVRDVLRTDWQPGLRVRASRRAAEVLEATDGEDATPGEIARLYGDSRSLPGAERGVSPAITAAEQALAGYDAQQAAEMFGLASILAGNLSPARRGEIESRHAVALLQSLQVRAGEEAALHAVALLQEGSVSSLVLADHCWRLAHALTEVDGRSAVRDAIRDIGLQTLGDRRDLPWARLRMLGDAIEVVPHTQLHVSRWSGYHPEARSLMWQRGGDEDQSQTIESFDPRTAEETRLLIRRARGWRPARATLRGLTAAANDLTYRHGQFRSALTLWQEVLATAERVGAVPWQANALNQITLLQVTLGEFALATATKQRADDINALLGASSDADALLMERDFALTLYLDGDWPGLAHYWLRFTQQPPQGLEAQLAVPLYAAMTTVAATQAGFGLDEARALLDGLATIARTPGVLQVNGVVAWAGTSIHLLQDSTRAATFDRLAANLLADGVGDYPQTSLALTRGRLLAVQGSSEASHWYEQARRDLEMQEQRPLLAIAHHEQALLKSTSAANRHSLLNAAIAMFEQLGMTTWLERAQQTLAGPAASAADLSAVSKRELEVLRLVARGYSDRRVADTLFISERTVNAHMRNMLTKTDSTNRTELASWAQARGILIES